jgi:hypothetical protein
MKTVLFLGCFCLPLFGFSQKSPVIFARYKNSTSKITEYLYIGENQYYYESTFFARRPLKMTNHKENYVYLKFDDYETIYEFFTSFERISLNPVQVPVQYRRINPDGSESIFNLEQYADFLDDLSISLQKQMLRKFADALLGEWSGKLNNAIDLKLFIENMETGNVQINLKKATTQVEKSTERYYYEGTAEIQEHKKQKTYKIILYEKNGEGRFELYLTSKGMQVSLNGFWKNKTSKFPITLFPVRVL